MRIHLGKATSIECESLPIMRLPLCGWELTHLGALRVTSIVYIDSLNAAQIRRCAALSQRWSAAQKELLKQPPLLPTLRYQTPAAGCLRLVTATCLRRL